MICSLKPHNNKTTEVCKIRYYYSHVLERGNCSLEAEETKHATAGEAMGTGTWSHALAHSKECYFHYKALPHLRHMLQELTEMRYVTGIWKLKSGLQIYEITKLL